MKEKLQIIKIGGYIIDDEFLLIKFLENFAKIKGNKILIHGGGKTATGLCSQLNLDQHFVDGRRITDRDTLDVIVMVYAGTINKRIVVNLQSNNCNAIGLSGADGNIIQAKKRSVKSIDYGFVGDISEDGINSMTLEMFLKNDLCPVICPLTHDGQGNLLNTNADTIAAQLAISMNQLYDVSLIYCFEKNGVLIDLSNENSLLSQLNYDNYLELKENKKISSGMLPKLENAFHAYRYGVSKVNICHWKAVGMPCDLLMGTTISA